MLDRDLAKKNRAVVVLRAAPGFVATGVDQLRGRASTLLKKAEDRQELDVSTRGQAEPQLAPAALVK